MTSLAIVSIGLATLTACATAPSGPEAKAQLGRDVATALAKAKVQDPGLQAFLDKAYAYAVLPNVGKGAIGVGGAYGRGEVFERGARIGYCDMSQATVGLALGGQTYTEIIAFENKAALDNFKNGRMKLAAQATAVALKAGASANAKYSDGVSVLTASPEGLMVEAAIGGQTFSFQPL
jgi:lipid-binding SYLF domain-containing protein